ncbi:hypothetical protein TBLA_0B08270 [Henningerozyma blattae CBS 6284]|uniref:2'-phosphotransferase n=1 Tax=Henningerozyma blattae (strain ATCC 34711 / CBS 6284 / DSM 70876 / NBRC 10599 / NRRL Y-10934 / UCD 77-7) TaxID=1071380 RepID=I2GZU1_HENB6|nr:hypothetical protein TBLA_0B08270 [Tetrapisispora blattae CBS 6284]CCH59643.1 hypothetical protein TBLA_0B08270 [Tetrapisispora blattae CBS 6284]
MQNNSSDAKKRDVHISKALSYLLRHGAVKENLKIDSNGYILVSDLLKHQRLKSFKTTWFDVKRIVRDNDKQRFHLKNKSSSQDDDSVENWYICATQGHSLSKVKPDENSGLLTPIILSQDEVFPTPLIHGTSVDSLFLIIKSGKLSKQKRNHIHLTTGLVDSLENINKKDDETKILSGFRNSSKILIYLKTSPIEYINDLHLLKSINGVVLTESNIPIENFEKIVIRNSKKDDVKIQKLIDLLKENNVSYEFDASCKGSL